MDIFTTYLLVILAVSIGLGFFAQAGRFCLAGGLREAFSSQGSSRLWAYFAAIAIALIGVSVIEYMQFVSLDETKPSYRSDQFAYGRYILGGLIFGFGMILASGCGMRNLIKSGQGNYKGIIMVFFMALAAYVMTKTSVYADVFLPIVTPFTLDLSSFGHQDLGSLITHAFMPDSMDRLEWIRLVISLAIAAVILFFAFKNKTFRQPRYFVSSIAVGAAIVAGYYITGSDMAHALSEEAEFMEIPPLGLGMQSYSFAAPMADTIYSAMNPVGLSVITFGVVAVIGLPIGSLIASLVRKEFKIEGFTSSKDFVISIVGALLAGTGAVLAMGCSVGHGLTGIATLAIGSFLALTSIVAGAYIGLKVEARIK